MAKDISFLDLSKQQERLQGKILLNINKVLEHGQFIMVPDVTKFETKLEQYTGAKYSASCASGTDALVLSLMALNIGPGDIVFCPTFTFPATAEAIVILGAIPFFIDVELDTFNISIDSLKKGIQIVKRKININLKQL